MEFRMNDSAADENEFRKGDFYTRPGYFIIITLLVVFVAEAIVMLILNHFLHLNVFVEDLLDSLLLSLLIFPPLYILLFRPLRRLVLAYRQALQEVKTLRGLLPICMKCKKILLPERDEYDQNSWQQIETYIESHSNTEFSHGLCPKCYKVWRKEMGLKEEEN